jgi:hypothetical protein
MEEDGSAGSSGVNKPLTEDQIVAGTVGELQIREALGDDVLLEHVGSTSVPRSPAKPVIDMVLAVADFTAHGRFVMLPF